jgi:hypothetical protein
MIIALIVAFLLGAYLNAFLARRKYNPQIAQLKETNSITLQRYYSRGYTDGYDQAKADEYAKQQNTINDIFLLHSN